MSETWGGNVGAFGGKEPGIGEVMDEEKQKLLAWQLVTVGLLRTIVKETDEITLDKKLEVTPLLLGAVTEAQALLSRLDYETKNTNG